MTWLASSGDSVFETFLNGTVRSAALLRAQTPEALRKIRAEVVAKVGGVHGGRQDHPCRRRAGSPSPRSDDAEIGITRCGAKS